jgi:ubiquinone/menaquinone biosynthesis C-methylase UbiE
MWCGPPISGAVNPCWTWPAERVVLAREAVRATGNDGNVTGLDRNDGMLAVAKRLAPGINWQPGLAEALPFAGRSFDRVFSQFALMFFDDRAAALREMRRVMKPGGRMHAAVWDSLDRTPRLCGHGELAEPVVWRAGGRRLAGAVCTG